MARAERKRVTATVVFMSPDECASRVQNTSHAEAVAMLKTLECAAVAARDAEWREAVTTLGRCPSCNALLLDPKDEYAPCGVCVPIRKLMEPRNG